LVRGVAKRFGAIKKPGLCGPRFWVCCVVRRAAGVRGVCCAGRLQVVVHGAAAAFGADPVDGLVGVADVAGFAVYAVGEVHLDALEFAGLFVFDDVVDLGRAEGFAGGAEFVVAFPALGGVHVQVAGLLFLVRGAAVVYVGEFVEQQFLVIELDIVRGLAAGVVLGHGLDVRVVLFELHVDPGVFALGEVVEAAFDEAHGEDALFHEGAEVFEGNEFLADEGVGYGLDVAFESGG